MIKKVPTEAHFYKSAQRFLLAAWQEALSAIEAEDAAGDDAESDDAESDDAESDDAESDDAESDDAESDDAESDDAESDDAESDDAESDELRESDALVIASINAFTGIEHLLRARIAAVSPYLLFFACKDWPKNCDKKDVDFGSFKTIDAQALIKLYNTVGTTRLPQDFLGSFEELRVLRNGLVHSHRANAATAREVLLAVLRATHVLVAPLTWMKWMRESLQYSYKGEDMASWSSVMNNELGLTVATLDPKDCETYLNIKKKQRFYFCPECRKRWTRYEHRHQRADYTQGMAQLENLETVYCRTCETRTKVRRVDCTRAINGHRCPGNVVEAGDKDAICLTCGETQDD